MVQRYHAHVYYRSTQKKLAESLYEEIRARMGAAVEGNFHSLAVGPHPLPMFTLMFDRELRREILEFFQAHRQDLVVLIHEDTGDDFRDHTAGAEWLGEPVLLDFNHFERIKYEKSALVFPSSRF